MHTKDKGTITELKVAADLAARGYKILVPFDENNSYDLVAEKDGKFIRIQVKSPSVDSDEDKVRFHCRVVNHTKCHKYKETDFDFMATYHKGNCYYLPSKITADRNSVLLRIKPHRNGNQHRSLNAADFMAP